MSVRYNLDHCAVTDDLPEQNICRFRLEIRIIYSTDKVSSCSVLPATSHEGPRVHLQLPLLWT